MSRGQLMPAANLCKVAVQPGEIIVNTMSHGSSETVQRSGYFSGYTIIS